MENKIIEEKTTIYLTSAYVPGLDITIIKEDTWVNNDIIKTEIKGFYYGEPSKEATEKFKNRGVCLEYDL